MAPKKKAARKRVSERKLILEKVVAQRAQTQTTAAALAQDSAPTPNPEIAAVAKLITAHALACGGFSDREVAAMLGTSSSTARDMIESGRVIAVRVGGTWSDEFARRMQAMRENVAADFAEKAAQGMKDRLLTIVPTAIRLSDGNIQQVEEILDTVTPADVVTRSALAHKIRSEPQPAGELQGTNEAGYKTTATQWDSRDKY